MTYIGAFYYTLRTLVFYEHKNVVFTTQGMCPIETTQPCVKITQGLVLSIY